MASVETKGSGRWKIVFLVVALAVLAIAAYAIKQLFDRPGEKALSLVPIGSPMFLSIDLAPSPGQVTVFDKIGQELNKYQFDFNTKQIVAEIADPSMAKSLAPYLGHGGAVAALPSSLKHPINYPSGSHHPNQTPDYVVIIGLTDVSAATSVLSEGNSLEKVDGLTCFHLREGLVGGIIAEQLVLAPNVEQLQVIKKVASGATQSVVNSAEYKLARGKLEADANVMFFMDKSAMALFPGYKSSSLDEKLSFEWMAYGLGVREGGISVSFAEGMTDGAAKSLAEMPPLKNDILKSLPSGAYGFAAASGLSNILQLTRDGLKGQDDGKLIQQVDEALRKASIDWDRDLGPALRGDTMLAVYPALNKHPYPEILLVVDDQNSGDPAALVPKLRDWMNSLWKQQDPKHEALAFKEEMIGGVPATVFDEKTTQSWDKQVNKAVGSGNIYGQSYDSDLDAQAKAEMSRLEEEMSKPPTNGAQPDFQKFMERMKKIREDSKNRAINGKPLLSAPAPCYAIVGKAVLMASSKEMLAQAIATYQSGKDSLADDPLLHAAGQSATGHEAITAASLSRIFTKIEESVPKEQAGQSPGREFLDFFEALKEPAVFSSSLSGQLWSGSGFIPMDVAKLISLVGIANEKAKANFHQNYQRANDASLN